MTFCKASLIFDLTAPRSKCFVRIRGPSFAGEGIYRSTCSQVNQCHLNIAVMHQMREMSLT